MPANILIARCAQSVLALSLALGVHSKAEAQRQLSNDQQLVIAAYELDLVKVKALLAGGANPNARLGFYDEHLFEDKWDSGLSPIGSEQWTPLLAACSSHSAPPPLMPTDNTPKSRVAAQKALRKVDPRLIRDRNERRGAIVKELVSAKANLDLNDGHGATALAISAPAHEEIALLLIDAGAEINTKEGIYIDGVFGQTPLHYATARPKLLKAMLNRKPQLDVQDSNGATPLHWAVHVHSVAGVKMLLEAGADPQVKDNEHLTPADWCKKYYTDADHIARQEITKALREVTEHPK
jgi:ankyrin repeat protein